MGKYFSGYEELQLELTQYEKENFVNLAKNIQGQMEMLLIRVIRATTQN